MREVYKAVEAAIRGILKPEIKDIGDIERFYGQLALSAQGIGKPVAFPAVYYELANIRTASRGRNIQDAEGILRLRLVDRAMDVKQLRTPMMEELVYFGLTGYNESTLMTGLERVAIYPDPSFAGIETIIQEWTIKWTDRSLKDRLIQTLPGGTLTAEPGFQMPK
jgi:hypothetical protein